MSSIKSFFKRFGSTLALLVLGLLIGIGLSFLYIQKFGIPFAKVAKTVSQVEEAKLIKLYTDNVSKLIMLPKGEEPVLATISDATALAKEQPFYAGSKNGDIVLVYQKALKAIIYSPDRNIIVNVGPVSVEQGATQNEQAPVVDTEETSTATKKK
jgi:hypothetical protein